MVMFWFGFFFNGPSLHRKWCQLQSIVTIKEIENLLIKVWKNMPRYYYSIETVFLCIIFIRFLLHCKMPECVSLFCLLICIFGGICHFPFSFYKFTGSFIQLLIQFERTLTQRRSRIDGNLICCWIQFLVMVRVFKITWEKCIKFI